MDSVAAVGKNNLKLSDDSESESEDGGSSMIDVEEVDSSTGHDQCARTDPERVTLVRDLKKKNRQDQQKESLNEGVVAVEAAVTQVSEKKDHKEEQEESLQNEGAATVEAVVLQASEKKNQEAQDHEDKQHQQEQEEQESPKEGVVAVAAEKKSASAKKISPKPRKKPMKINTRRKAVDHKKLTLKWEKPRPDPVKMDTDGDVEYEIDSLFTLKEDSPAPVMATCPPVKISAAEAIQAFAVQKYVCQMERDIFANPNKPVCLPIDGLVPIISLLNCDFVINEYPAAAASSTIKISVDFVTSKIRAAEGKWKLLKDHPAKLIQGEGNVSKNQARSSCHTTWCVHDNSGQSASGSKEKALNLTQRRRKGQNLSEGPTPPKKIRFRSMSGSEEESD